MNNIIEKIIEWCRNNYYDNFIVSIKINELIISEYLEYDGDNDLFIWEHDWYEGEKDVELVGFIPINNLIVYNDPDNPIIFHI